MTAGVYEQIIEHCINGLPNEACGLLAGEPGSPEIVACYPTGNSDASPVVYTIDSRDQIKADLDAESKGLEIIGVFHSHVRSDAYPSETDVAKAVDPNWHYILVSLRGGEPELRAFRIIGGVIEEEPWAIRGNGEGPQG